MASILSGFVKPAMEKLGRIAVVKIKHLFIYLCFFNNSIESLRNEAQKLENERLGLQRQVDEAENNAGVILPRVRTWLENANTKILVDMGGIDDRIPTVKNGCWGVKSRFRLSREAVKITGEMKQLMDELRWITPIAMPPLPPARVAIPLETTHEFPSRKQIEEDIMNALRAKEFTIMGICGMGGVGKTTMAKRIMYRAKKENIFQEIIMVVVSQQVDMLKIQCTIAEYLDLMLVEESLLARATKLRARVTGEKRILIVFDDVWDKFELEDLGIPCESERCRILLTSRNKDVLKKMDAKVYGVEILSDTEAWILFREKAGSCVEDPSLLSTAKNVASECKRLPLALVTIGGALKDKTNIILWEHALRQLQSSNPEDIPDVIRDVYNPLRLSYTYLGNRRAKSLFLLCSLFSKDVDINLEELTSYCLGLRMFPNWDSSNASVGILEGVRRRVFATVHMLKNRFLLLEGTDEHYVRMPGVVHDVAIFIAGQEAKEGLVEVKLNSMLSSSEYKYEWVSFFSEKISSLLRMHGSNLREELEIKEFSIFKGIKQLNVLSFEYIFLKSIPLEIQILKNLRTLRLASCGLQSLSAVGELLSLEILYCPKCDGIEELPVEIGNLNQLKLLDFTDCRSLKRIPPGVILNLVELEEFKMLRSFNGWELAGAAEVQGQERSNACLNEFEKLSKLTCLEIEVKNINLAAEEICFSPDIERYYIRIGGYLHDLDTSHAKGMCLHLSRGINLGSWVLKFLRSADMLCLIGHDLRSLDLPQAHNMKSLMIENCSTEVVNSTTTSVDGPSSIDVFPMLENLKLCGLPNLEEAYGGPVLDGPYSFWNLRSLYLSDLPALKHLCKQRPNRNIVSLDKLRHITIKRCNNLHSLFSFTTSNGTDQIARGRDIDELLCTQKVSFDMLETMELEKLDKLEVIWNSPLSKESRSFNNLRSLTLIDLPSMIHLWKNFNLSVLLNNLSRIAIDGCHKLRNLFSSTMLMEFLPQLKELEILNCEMMEQVLLNEENENDENQCRAIKFPKLSELTLDSLPSLTTFSKGIKNIDFPLLEDMVIKNCPKFMSFISSNGNYQNSAGDDDDDTFYLFCSKKVSFGSLKRVSISMASISIRNIWYQQIPVGLFSQLAELKIKGCDGIRSLFSSSIAENLVHLKKLTIKNCTEMVTVMEDGEEIVCDKPRILFLSLGKLVFFNLPKLERFCSWRCGLHLPLLEELTVNRCWWMEFFTMTSITTPNLKRIILDKNEKDTGDLNGAIQLHFEANQHQRISTTRNQLQLKHEERSVIEEEEIKLAFSDN